MTDHVKAIVDGVRPMIEVVDAKAKALEARIDDLSSQVRERATASSLPGVEPKKFSFAKAIHAIKSGDFSQAGYEAEVFGEMRKKALSFGTAASGGYLVPDEVRNDLFVGATRANNVLFQTNVLRVTSSGGAPIRIPKISAGHSGGWIAENGSNSAADQTYAEITLTPKRAFAATLMSNTLIRRDAASAEAVVRADLEAAVSETLLNGYLMGSGSSNQPTGLNSLSGTTAVTGSAASVLDVMNSLLRGLQKIEENQGDIGQCVFVMHPKAWYYLLSASFSGVGTVTAATATATQQLPVGFASAVFGINSVGQKTIMGVPVYLTTAMTVTNASPDTSTILLYQPSNTIFAEFGPMELLVTNAGSTLGLADQTLVRVVQEVDFNARIAAQVVKITGTYSGNE
ncbi:MAG: hypothetical protein RIS21_213 [Planctomycetota bacterium]|jgi:HK97 family phage major capsid protein